MFRLCSIALVNSSSYSAIIVSFLLSKFFLILVMSSSYSAKYFSVMFKMYHESDDDSATRRLTRGVEGVLLQCELISKLCGELYECTQSPHIDVVASTPYKAASTSEGPFLPKNQSPPSF